MGLLHHLSFLSRPSSSSFFLLPFLFLSLFLPVNSTVLPSNNTADLPSPAHVRFHLEGTQVDLPRSLDLAPLTRSLLELNDRQYRDFNQTGTLVPVANSLSLQESDIAFISCDPDDYPGNLDASATVAHVLNSPQKPAAVVLYSTTLSHCNYTDDGSGYSYIFTSLSADSASYVETQLRSSNRPGLSYILADMESYLGFTGNTGTDVDGGGGGRSPNTAMIILYSITGIITALFLSIIITGAVRAHRHPERYGPRRRPGRPRQSRARGIARAMLETIPIVKFGDTDDGKPVADKGDLEMSIDSEVREDETHNPPMATGGTTLPESETTRNNAATSVPDSDPEKRAGREAETTTSTTDYPNFSCPICTDDFVKGQDLRVLPCNHQFHPECIDPWLVNVSGTCPLCRIDLNPPQPEGEPGDQEGEHHPEGQEAAAAVAATTTTPQPAEETPTHRRRLSNYLHGPLNARRMRDASVEERLAALRSVREEADATRGTEAETDEQRRRRHRLTARLREKFRIRTRAHGEDTANTNANAAASAS
ncbi:hypothetical protein BJX61DRAFT_539898 [Aspergillus egyptiacus]|nr:hypothetical protein BJX61DRAFT_539898 [Aspergillus egyptiacus]